jgi:hypothetical protein
VCSRTERFYRMWENWKSKKSRRWSTRRPRLWIKRYQQLQY